MSNAILRVKASRLRRKCDPQSFKFDTTASLPVLQGFVDQPRAIKGLELGLLSDDKSFNIRVIHSGGTSRSSALLSEIVEIVNRYARANVIEDCCCVFNFDDPNSPEHLALARGHGKKFRQVMKELRDKLKQEVPEEFSNIEAGHGLSEINKKAAEISKRQDKEVYDAGKRYNVVLKRVEVRMKEGSITYILPEIDHNTDFNYQLFPIGNNPQQPDYVVVAPPSREQWLGDLPSSEEEMGELRELIQTLENRIRKELSEWNKERFELYAEIYANATIKIFDALSADLADEYPQAKEYLNALRKFISKNHGIFSEQQKNSMLISGANMEPFKIFDVNVLVDNSYLTDAAPVIFEDDPTFRNIFGRIVRPGSTSTPSGGYMMGSTDHTSLQAGSLLRANGGVLVIPVESLVMNHDFLQTWRLLINSLRNKEVVVEDLADRMGLWPTGNFKPKPIPLNVRVVLVTNHNLDRIFSMVFPDDYGLFRAKAEFVSTTKRNSANQLKLAQFLGVCSRKENLPHANSEACAVIVEFASWLAHDSRKLSLNFNKVKDLLLQAAYWARKRTKTKDPKEITAGDVKKALEQSDYRSDAIRERMLELMREGILKMNIDGERVGRINALAVYQMGDFAFGIPSVVSAATSLGKYDVVNIEHEVGMAGPSQHKSIKIISGYFRRCYGKEMPLALHAQITFEQNYGGVDGDSASLAELIALISDLTDIPIKQSIAITGSCNHHGDAQAIGAVNYKIAGFLDACMTVGKGKLIGCQGVVIPKDNLNELMLREDVVEAVDKGEFHIYAVSTVEEAAEVMMGKPWPEIDKLVREKLRELAETAREWSKDTADERADSEDSR